MLCLVSLILKQVPQLSIFKSSNLLESWHLTLPLTFCYATVQTVKHLVLLLHFIPAAVVEIVEWTPYHINIGNMIKYYIRRFGSWGMWFKLDNDWGAAGTNNPIFLAALLLEFGGRGCVLQYWVLNSRIMCEFVLICINWLLYLSQKQ